MGIGYLALWGFKAKCWSGWVSGFEEKEGVMRNAMTTRAPCGAKNHPVLSPTHSRVRCWLVIDLLKDFGNVLYLLPLQDFHCINHIVYFSPGVPEISYAKAPLSCLCRACVAHRPLAIPLGFPLVSVHSTNCHQTNRDRLRAALAIDQLFCR